jgi:hypothetical protein
VDGRRRVASTHRSAGASSAAARIPDASTSAHSGRSRSARSRCTQCTRRCGCRRRTSTLDRTRRMLRRRGWTWELWRRPRPTPPPRRVASARAAPSADAGKLCGSAGAARCEEEREGGSRASSEGVEGRKVLTEGAPRSRPCHRVAWDPTIPCAVWLESEAPLSWACHRKGRDVVRAQTSWIEAFTICHEACTRPGPLAQQVRIATATMIATPRHPRRA